MKLPEHQTLQKKKIQKLSKLKQKQKIQIVITESDCITNVLNSLTEEGGGKGEYEWKL